MYPIEIVLIPCVMLGSIALPGPTFGDCEDPIISGTLGPYTSASISPTRWPSLLSAMARFTATVVLPTPPLPDPTATIFLTPGNATGAGMACPCAINRSLFPHSDFTGEQLIQPAQAPARPQLQSHAPAPGESAAPP